MYEIVSKQRLNDQVSRMVVRAPYAARHAQPGQFVILRVNEQGERIPLTIAGYDRQQGTITIIYQKVGATTRLLDTLKAGDRIKDFAGPLGRASELEGLRRAAVIGGGLGAAIAYPQARALWKQGAWVDGILGFRSREQVILQEEFSSVCQHLSLMTDDGSAGRRGFVTAALEERLKAGEKYDAVFAAGPLPMMKAVSELTRPWGIKTVVSMNPLMIDGTGMCGCCRIMVGGEMKFACVDGPEFDGHLVDFDSAIKSTAMFDQQEKLAREEKGCRLMEVAL